VHGQNHIKFAVAVFVESDYWFLCLNSWTRWLLLRKRRRLTMKTWVWQKHTLTTCQPSVSVTYFILHPYLPRVSECWVCLLCHMALIGNSSEWTWACPRHLCQDLWIDIVMLAVVGLNVVQAVCWWFWQ